MPNYSHISNKKRSQISLLKKRYVRTALKYKAFLPNTITAIHLNTSTIHIHIQSQKPVSFPPKLVKMLLLIASKHDPIFKGYSTQVVKIAGSTYFCSKAGSSHSTAELMGVHEESESVLNGTDLELAYSISIKACGLNLSNCGDGCQGNVEERTF